MKKPKAIFDKVERELIKADIEMLKAEERKSGDWKKWLKSQEIWGENKFKSNRELCDLGPYTRRSAEGLYGPDPRIKPRTKKK